MTGTVFISCGQLEAYEKDAANKVAMLLATEFNLDAYVATETQSFDDIMKITDRLRSSDYFLFIDFNRRSLFTHQEFALAHHLGFGRDIIALREKNAPPMEGFVKYVLANPKIFDGTDELLREIRNLAKAKGWTSQFSRNLVVTPTLSVSGPVPYVDHTGQSFQQSWRVTIENRRPDAAAVGTVCILDSIRFSSGDTKPSDDRGYLKWVGHQGYERTILPMTSEAVDVFAVRPDKHGLFLLSTRDGVPREPIATENGNYELSYKVFAREFPVLEFAIRVDLTWEAPTPSTWTIKTNAALR